MKKINSGAVSKKKKNTNSGVVSKKEKKINSSAISLFDYLYEELISLILTFVNVADLATLTMVCKSFNRLVRDPLLWQNLDLSKLHNFCFQVPTNRLGVWDDEQSSTKLIKLFKFVLNLSRGITTCLVFNYYVYLTDELLIFMAERTPNLKRLILPHSGNISRDGLKKALELWKDLESITITSMVSNQFIFSAINKYGKNITQVKFTSDFHLFHAKALIKHAPNLTTLSIRSVIVSMKALCRVVKSMKHLEEVNICHSVLMDKPNPNSQVIVYRIRDLRTHLDEKDLKKLIICIGDWCLRCKNGHDTTSSRQPYGPFEDMWRADEIPSLAH